MIYTLTSSGAHRILTIEPGRSAAGEQDRSQTACRPDFPQQMHPALTRRPEIRVRRSSKMVSPYADGQRPNGLALGDLPGVEQVELDFPDDAGLAWLPGGEVAGFP